MIMMFKAYSLNSDYIWHEVMPFVTISYQGEFLQPLSNFLSVLCRSMS